MEAEQRVEVVTRELKEKVDRCLGTINLAERRMWDAHEEAAFWKDRYVKLAWLANQAIMDIPRSLFAVEGMHRYATHSRSKAMENKIEALELQNQDLKGEVSQLKEQMAQMFQILSKTNTTITAMANHSTAGHA
ncbi:hypothetical protein CR513_24789, partial [Mucuna pruriens]